MRLLLLPILLGTALVMQTESRHISRDDVFLSVIPLRDTTTTHHAPDETGLQVQPLAKAPRGKAKRNVSRRSWSGNKSYNNPPPYLVFNRKIGAYYPYNSFPTENSVRRSRVRKVGQQQQ